MAGKIYVAENIITGETIKGTAQEVSQKLKASISTVRTYTQIDMIYKKQWKFSLFGNANELTEEDLKEWDEVTKKFKKATYKKKYMLRKPQERR